MKLNGVEIEIIDEEKFFAVMDTFTKEVLSTDISKGIPTREDKTVFVVATHAIALPKEAEEKLQPYIKKH